MKALKLLAVPVLATILTPFVATARDLPVGWTRVLYVQGNPSTQARIKANYKLNSGRRIVAEVEFTDLSGTMALWCSRNTEYQGSYSCFLNSNGVQFDYYGSNANPGNGERVRLATGGLSIGDKWTIVMDDVNYSVSNGESTYEGSASTITTKMGEAWQNMTLFASYRNNPDANLDSYANYRLYSMKEYKNGDLVHDLVPCTDADGNATVYDLVDGSTAVFTVVGTLIAGKPVYESDFATEVPDQVFDGATPCEPHPVVTLKTSGEVLVEGADYTLSWADNDRAGKGELIVTGINAYAGQKGNFFFSIFSEYGRGKVFYAMPDGTDDADCQTWNTAGSLSNALARLNAAPAGTANDWNWVVLLAGSPDVPAVYDLSSFAGGDLASFTTLSKSYMGIRSAAIDHDARSVVIRGGGTAKKMRFAQASSGKSGSLASHQILDITFEDFCAQGAGGAILRGNDYTTLTVSNCVFRNNTAVGGSSGAVNASVAYDCDFVGNVTTNSGSGGGASYGGSFYGCSFVSNVNYCTGHYAGGALYGEVVASNCLFIANRATQAEGVTGKQDWGQTLYGGTVYDSYFKDSSGLTCRACYRCRIESGAANYAGSVYSPVWYDCVMTNCTKILGKCYNCLITGCDSGNEVLMTRVTMYNSTIVNNKTTGTASGWNARAITMDSHFYNCVFCNPDARREFTSNGAQERGTAEHCLLMRNENVTATDCLFMEEKGWTMADLGFEGRGEHPYNPKANSPLVDAGALYADHATAACTNDIRGLKRVSGKTVDIGCYEYQQLTADFEIAEIPVQRYNGIDPCQPDPVVTLKDGGAVLVKGQDYLVTWSDNDKLGEALVTVTGIGAYAGQGATRTFTVKSSYGDGRIFFAKPDGSETSDCLSWATAGTIDNAVGKMTAASGSATAAERWWVVLLAGTPESPAVYDLSALADGSRQSYVSLTKGYTGLMSSAEDLDARRIIVRGGGVAAAAKMRFATVSQVNDFWGITFEDFCSQSGGGAIYASGSAATLSVSNCNFTGNVTYSGGGGAIFGCKYAYGCDFTGNVSTNTSSYGGAINGGVSAYDCSFVSNRNFGTSHHHGGALEGPVLVDHCYFEANLSAENSSEQQNKQNWGNTIYGQNCVVTNCEFVNSSGISASKVYRSVFTDRCSAKGSATTFGTVFYDCVMTNGCTSVGGTCYNCLIADNDSGMNCLLSGTFYNSTVVNNKTTGTGGQWYQRGVAGGQTSATLYNCFFYNPDAYREFCIGNNNTPSVKAYSCFLTTKANVIDDNCTFVNTLGSTVEERWAALRLDWDSPYPYIQKRASPLVNAGTNLAIHATAACTNDIRGVSRIIGGRVDVGCYEYMPKIGFMLILK